MNETNIEDEWSKFISKSQSNDASVYNKISEEVDDKKPYTDNDAPICGDLNISTTTKILLLNQSIDINDVFWKIPIIAYGNPIQGVIKKQMKIVSHTPEEYSEYTEKLHNIEYYTEHIIKRIDNPTARRNRFKDERKITVGISKKDIMNCRGKVKNAFYNCFAIFLRFKYQGIFREIHAKIFNTGKMEIPGIVNNDLLNIVSDMILSILKPIISINNSVKVIITDYKNSVLINSNFNSGFYINREKVYSILRSDKYNIETAYDPCSYPGVKCKYYFNHEFGYDNETQRGFISTDDCNQKMNELGENKKYTEISFMIFRTGSCLIVGNCTQDILNYVYVFITNMLREEYINIAMPTDSCVKKIKQHKIRKRTITCTKEYINIIAT
jgi:hypothetical protein